MHRSFKPYLEDAWDWVIRYLQLGLGTLLGIVSLTGHIHTAWSFSSGIKSFKCLELDMAVEGTRVDTRVLRVSLL